MFRTSDKMSYATGAGQQRSPKIEVIALRPKDGCLYIVTKCVCRERFHLVVPKRTVWGNERFPASTCRPHSGARRQERVAPACASCSLRASSLKRESSAPASTMVDRLDKLASGFSRSITAMAQEGKLRKGAARSRELGPVRVRILCLHDDVRS